MADHAGPEPYAEDLGLLQRTGSQRVCKQGGGHRWMECQMLPGARAQARVDGESRDIGLARGLETRRGVEVKEGVWET